MQGKFVPLAPPAPYAGRAVGEIIGYCVRLPLYPARCCKGGGIRYVAAVAKGRFFALRILGNI